MPAIVLFIIGYLVIVVAIAFATRNKAQEKNIVFKKVRGRRRSIRTRLLK